MAGVEEAFKAAEDRRSCNFEQNLEALMEIARSMVGEVCARLRYGYSAASCLQAKDGR